MISWKCDGCGKTEESRYTYVRGSMYGVTSGPVPPERWWVARIPLPTKKGREGSLPRYEDAENVYHACSGTCADNIERTNPHLRLTWKAP